MAIAAASQLLSEARIHHRRRTELPQEVRPKTAEEAYLVQEILVQQLLAYYGGTVIGYKIACTNPTAQRQLNVEGPFYGHLLSSFCSESPARLRASDFFMRVIEAEFGFQMARDLPPVSAPRHREEVAAVVEGVIPGIEIVDSRFESWTTIGALSLTADQACNAAWVRGPLLKNWQAIDLAAQPVRLTVNGSVLREGTGSAVLGHPLNALLWLANMLSSRGLGLKAGQYITTGVTTEVYMAERGDVIAADFGPVGSAELLFD
jgi:2-keto-4-pentenoate hydratase